MKGKLNFITVILVIAAALYVMPLAACSYGKQTEKVLDISAGNYSPYYTYDGNLYEVVVAKSSPYAYYFCENESGFTMQRDRFLSWSLYLEDEPDDYFSDKITYDTASGEIAVNSVTKEYISLNYEGFRSYCLDYYGDSANDNFTSVMYGIVQGCLAESDIYEITEGDAFNFCYADIDLSYVCENTAYLQFIESSLSADEYAYFTSRLSELSSAQQGVTLEIMTDSSYTTLYRHLIISRNGVNWLHIDFASLIVYQ